LCKHVFKDRDHRSQRIHHFWPHGLQVGINPGDLYGFCRYYFQLHCVK
jgi:hypothetical protein